MNKVPCPFCLPVLGKIYTHTEDDCALKRSAYCPLCGFGQHFQADCPKKPKRKLAYGFGVIKTSSVKTDDPRPKTGKPNIDL